jgi:hypothetical protein
LCDLLALSVTRCASVDRRVYQVFGVNSHSLFPLLDKYPQALPDKMIRPYLSVAKATDDQEALRQLTILQDFLDNRVAPNDIDRATVSLCKRMAERMVKAGIWTEDALDQFSLWPPESDATH